MSDHDPHKVHFVDKLVDKFLPIHVHYLLAEVDKKYILNTKTALYDVFPVIRAVYKRNVLLKNQRVRVDVKGQHRRNRSDLGGTLFCSVKKLRMSHMDPVEKTQRHYFFIICHIKPQKSF